jgi:hypothetical protein
MTVLATKSVLGLTSAAVLVITILTLLYPVATGFRVEPGTAGSELGFTGSIESHNVGLDDSLSYDHFLPSSLWKCFVATMAGSLFAVLAVIVEGLKKKPKCQKIPRAELADLIPKRAVKATVTQPVPPAPKSALGVTPAAIPSPTASTPPPTLSVTPSAPSASRSPTAWKPGGALTKDQQIERSIKSLLNKLTRDNYSKLYTQLLETGICEQVHIECLAREVFMKATTQHSFIEMYADLCRDMHESLQDKGISETANFKRVLLDRCQESFGQYMVRPSIDESLSYEEKYEELVKYKTKMLGNMRLVGQLLCRKMLSPKIIFLCVDELLRCGTEEALETLCAFLDTIGPSFDTPEWIGAAKLHEVFGLVKILSEDSGQAPRIRCLLKDVLDKKNLNWKEVPARATPETTSQQKTRVPSPPKALSSADHDSCWRSGPARNDRTPERSPIGHTSKRLGSPENARK